MKLVVLAYTSKKYMSEKLYIPFDPIQTDRADLTRKLTCMDTWVSRLKDKGIEVIFFDGDNDEVSYDEKNQILHVVESDTYDYHYLHQQKKPSNMVKKFQGALRWLLENRDFDFVLRVDDGTYVNSFVIESYFDYIQDKDMVYSGHGGGGGIFFSKKICEEILNINDDTNHLEDMTFFNHFSKNYPAKIGTIDTMSSFYNLGENNLTIHYSTGKRMYYCDFIISNYHNGTKSHRKLILNYRLNAGLELNTNRVSGTNGKTGLWYGLDRDVNNWEYYGNYARSISDIYDRTITYGNDTVQNLCIFEMNHKSQTKINRSITELYKTLIEGGQLNIFFNVNTDGQVIEKFSYESAIESIMNMNKNYEILNNINFKEYINAEYINPNEVGTVIKLIK